MNASTKCSAADAIILASPVYFADVSAQIKALIDRAGMTAIANDDMFRRKLGASVVAARRGGAIHTFHSLNNFFFISQMIVPGSSYWNMGFGKDPGEVEKDEEARDHGNTGPEYGLAAGKNITLRHQARPMKSTSSRDWNFSTRVKISLSIFCSMRVSFLGLM